MFHKGVLGLPWMKKNPRSIGPVPEGDYEVPIGKAEIVRPGRDVSIVTLSLSVHHALDVAEELATQGIDCEVVDLRSLVPLDTDTILESVGRTGKLLVVDEDYLSYGLSGEVIARVAERDPSLLRAPATRVAVPDVPIPYARSLEYAVLPTVDRIRRAVLELVSA
jgi:pyruvate dehydrogenase E1 component beta subunit